MLHALLRAQPVRARRDPRRSTRRPRSRRPACASCSPPPISTPTSKEQWHTSIGAASPETPRPPLADGEVRFVGDPVALVVAESRALAEDAAELVDVDYEPLPAVVDYTDRRARRRARARRPRLQRDRRAHRPARVGARRRVRGGRARRRRETIYQQACAPAPMEGARADRRLLARDRRAHDLRRDAGAARGAAVLLAPARHAGAPHPRRSRATPAAASARRCWCSATRCA